MTNVEEIYSGLLTGTEAANFTVRKRERGFFLVFFFILDFLVFSPWHGFAISAAPAGAEIVARSIYAASGRLIHTSVCI